jgi:hypothetical protein
MARKSLADQQKAKEAKQKKIVLGLLPLLGILVFLQAPKLLHHSAGNVALAPPAATTDPAAVPVATGAVPSVGAAPSVGTAASPGAPVSTPATSPSGLADTDIAPPAGDGQLVAFDLFSSKDPFVQQVQAAGSASSSSDTPASSAPAKPAKSPVDPFSSSPSAGSAGKPTAPTEAMTTVAAVTVNGRLEQVQLTHDFPAAAPIFHLVTATKSVARIAVVDGAYQDGAPTLALPKGKTVTLLNTADGTRYALVYRGLAKVPTASLPKEIAPVPTTTTSATTTTTAATTTTASTP